MPVQKTDDKPMGSVQSAPHQNLSGLEWVKSEELQYVADNYQEEIITDPQDQETLLISGSVVNLLEELKIMIELLGEGEESKDVSMALLQNMLSHFSVLSNTRFRPAINLLVLEVFKHTSTLELNIEEIDSWWPDR